MLQAPLHEPQQLPSDVNPGGLEVTAGYRAKRDSGTFSYAAHAALVAVDPDTGQRYDDVIVFWVPSEGDKQALIQDPTTPFFTTAHFNGHPSVLVRASRHRICASNPSVAWRRG